MLEKLFTSKNRVKIIQFFIEHNGGYIRQISNQLKISPSAVKRELENLVSIGILSKDNDVFRLNTVCNFLDDLKNIFIKTEFVSFPLLTEVKKLKNISFALIFGSFAQGIFSQESDIDILIIGSCSPKKVYAFAESAEKKIRRSINPVLMSFNEFKKESKSSFIRDILIKKYIMLLGKEDELRKIVK